MTWVIAYGSNLDPVQLATRVGKVARTVPGRIPGWKLAFDKLSDRQPGATFANIVPDPDGSCPAVAFLFDPRQLALMDGYEGAPDHYGRAEIAFIPADSQGPRLAQAWIACPERVGEGRPSPEYLGRIRRGYAHFGFDDASLG